MMLETLFSSILNMSITGSIVIGCVLMARLALRKAPRGFAYVLWAVVVFRLLCPVSVSSPVSVLNLVVEPLPELSVGAVEYAAPPAQTPEGTLDAAPGEAAPAGVDWNAAAARVWSLGAAGVLGYNICSYVNLKRKLREAVPAEPGVYETDRIGTALVLGLFRPVIYLPAGLEEREREYILLHERFHIRHGDSAARMLFFTAVCLHWFNPLVWLAFVLFGRDMEMRCDEAVLKRLGDGIRSDYAQSLLNLSAGHYGLAAPLAFGEGDTGKRVKHVLKWKKAGGWALALAAVVCAVVMVATALNPGQPAQETGEPSGTSAPTESAPAVTEAVDPVQWKPVQYRAEKGYIELQIPQGWEYTVTQDGISFWPRGLEAGKIHLNYYPELFGVCGTMLESEVITLASGMTAVVGTYGLDPVWSHISFNVEADGDFAAIGEGHEIWWTEYGETAMAILATARMGEYPEETE